MLVSMHQKLTASEPLVSLSKQGCNSICKKNLFSLSSNSGKNCSSCIYSILDQKRQEMSLELLLRKRKATAEDLISRALSLSEIKGNKKLMRKLTAEKDFLASLDHKSCNDEHLEGHLKSSNLTHHEAIIATAESVTDVVSVLKKVSFEPINSSASELVVDVEASNGKLWFKVIARNPYAVHRVWEGLGQFGDKDVCQLASNYQEAARQNLVEFREPKIVFLFAGGVTRSVADDLMSRDVAVIGNVISDPADNVNDKLDSLTIAGHSLSGHVASLIKTFESSTTDSYEVEKVNLDITTLIALVSSLTNGNSHFTFEDNVLNLQAEEERNDPVLPKLNAFLANKQLYVCDTAISDFNNILKTIGGKEEIERAEQLIKRLTIVKDEPSERSMQLLESASVKMRSKIIFGTGDNLKAKTATANRSFVRAAHDQGVDFSVFLHSSRALTERKQTVTLNFPE